MSATTLPRPDGPTQTRLRIVDCDVHPAMRSAEELDRWLPPRWQQHRREYGLRLRQPFTSTYPYPKSAPALSRRDSWPPNGGPPGSDLDFMRQQHLDFHDIEYGMLQPLSVRGMDERVPGFAEAVSCAVNEWQHDDWTSKDARLKGTIAIPGEDAKASVKEIERWAGHPDFVQVSMVTRALEPLGSSRYWPIYEAAAHYGLPLGLHTLGTSGHSVTGGGWPSYYYEEHQAVAMSLAGMVASFILEGVPERFPTLKMVIIEGGFGWVPSLGWRMDSHWPALRSEVPHLKRKPSEYLRSSFWFTTQPVEEPEDPAHLRKLISWIGWDRLLFATDYPHWDSDDPRYAFKCQMSEAETRAIFAGNAKAVYRIQCLESLSRWLRDRGLLDRQWLQPGGGHRLGARPGAQVAHAPHLLGGLPDLPGWMVGDRGLVSDAVRERIWDMGARPAILPGRRGAPVVCPDWIQANCRLVEDLWPHSKRQRAIATHFGKVARFFLGVLSFATTMDWLQVTMVE